VTFQFGNVLRTAIVSALLPALAPVALAFELDPVASFDQPVDVREAPGIADRLFVVEQPGRIMVVKNDVKLATPFLDITGLVQVSQEEGLLSLAFPPDYKSSRRFYVWYVNNSGNLVLAEFRRSRTNPDRALSKSRRTVLVVNHPVAGNHNGGQLHFDGRGRLYISVGDGGNPGLDGIEDGEPARDRKKLLGKILRINPLKSGTKPYTIPKSNPYVGKPGRDEIYAYGVRNPWRFSLESGAIIVADVGQGTEEEITAVKRTTANGGNFGWPQWEGTFEHRPPSAMPNPIAPIHTYANDHSTTCAVVGGYVVNDPGLPTLAGRYIYGDNCASDIRSFAFDLQTQQISGDAALGLSISGVTSFGRGLNGQIYVVGNGSVYRLEPSPP
jgi:glucose/arabinose dehydrogenase